MSLNIFINIIIIIYQVKDITQKGSRGAGNTIPEWMTAADVEFPCSSIFRLAP